MTSPQLFRAAITSSTFIPSQYYYNAAIPRVSALYPSCILTDLLQALFDEVATQAGYDLLSSHLETRSLIHDLSCNGPKPLDCLHAVDSATMADINRNVMLASFENTFPFGPVIDGSFVTQSPTDALFQGHLNRVNRPPPAVFTF